MAVGVGGSGGWMFLCQQQHKSMQQISILIILVILSYVQGIRYDGGSNNNNEQLQQQQRIRTNNSHQFQPLYYNEQQQQKQRDDSVGVGMARQSTFRPSKIIDFTLNDATLQQGQQQQNYQPQQQLADNNVILYASADNNNNNYNKQFKFPTIVEQQQQEKREQMPYALTASNLAVYNYNNKNKNNENFKTHLGELDGVRKSLPVQLQSTPILSYKDPYTNENYQQYNLGAGGGGGGSVHDVPSSAQLDIIQQYQPEQVQPEEYIVGTSYFVGNTDGNKPANNIGNHYRPPNGLVSPEVLPSTPTLNTNAGERLSYDSHDYPPPSYVQPHRQYPSIPPTMSNYANNFDNYLATTGEQQQQQDYNIPTYQNAPGYVSPSSLSFASSASKPQTSSYGSFQNNNNNNNNNYNNYVNDNNYNNNYGYIPQSVTPITYQQQQQQQQHLQQQEYYRPQRPVIPAPPPAHGFPSLASFFSTTQEYAPQFTNFLLNGLGGGGGGGVVGSENPSKSPAIRPLRNMQLIKALENIARNDDLQCVPKVLCQMIAAQTQRGQLPAFITSPTITNFLSGFPVTSPMLIYGRAALLGLSGGDNSCIRSYLKCPKNEYEILYYLNNHRGGFFKFFSEPDDLAILQQQQQQQQQQQSVINQGGGQDGESSLFSIFSAITGIDAFTSPPITTTTTPRPPPPPPPRPATTSLDAVGNFFTKVLSEYLNGVEYQRRRRRSKRSTIISNDDDKNNEEGVKIVNEEEEKEEEEEEEEEKVNEDVESRILHKELRALDEPTFFPTTTKLHKKRPSAHRNGRLLKSKPSKKYVEIIKKFNANRAHGKLKFPSETADDDRMTKTQVQATDDEYFEDVPDGDDMNSDKQVVFASDYEYEGQIPSEPSQMGSFVNFVPHEPHAQRIVFHDDDDDDNNNNDGGNDDQQPHDTQINVGPLLKEREHRNFVFPDQQYNDHHIRKGRILNRPTYASQYNDYEASHRLPHNDRNSHINHIATTNKYFSNYNAYDVQLTTRRTPTRHKDDDNIYVTNGRGETEYYVTPGGHKVYLRNH